MSSSDYVFRYEPVYFKARNESPIYPVARRKKPNATVWLSPTGREPGHVAHVLSDDGLAIFFVSVLDEERVATVYRGVEPAPLWSVSLATFYWPTSQIPDGVSASRLIVWDPFIPMSAQPMEPERTQALQELLLPALTRWPDRRDSTATAGSAVVLRSHPRPLSVAQQSRIWLPGASKPPTASISPSRSHGAGSVGLFRRLLRLFKP